MANFGKEGPGEFGRVQANPASPSGLAQTAARFQGEQQVFEAGESRLRPWMPETSYGEVAKSWYSGANVQGMENGWDTTFYRQMWNQRDAWVDKAAQANQGRGSPTTFFNWLNPNVNKAGPNSQGATGVSTWDDPNVKFETKQGQKTMAFGDVFNNGEWVGNVYQDYDEYTADLMMGDILGFTNDEKARAFADPDRVSRYRQMVEGQRQINSEQAKYAPQQEATAENIHRREGELHEAGAPEVLAGTAAVLSGVMAGGTAGLLAGSWTGPGAIVTGVLGGIAGGIGAWLNQDQLVEMTARGMEKVDQANKNFGWTQALPAAVHEVGAVGGKLITPLGNTYQGLYDAKHGDVGDMTSEFYAIDPNTGERQASTLAKAGDIIATAGDFGLQFSSGVGRMLYMGSMGGVTIGGVGELTANIWTDAGRFNESKGAYDSYDNWQEVSAAIANVGIDAVQMGTAGLIGRAAASSRAAFGAETEVLVGREVTVNGMRYTLDDMGRATSAKFTLEALAPSEFLKWVPTGYRARMMRDVDAGMPIYDDLYRASLELSKGQSTFRDALINGYAEAGEEAFQAVFERAQFSERASFGEVAQAALYGAAGGFGMSLGAKNQRASSRAVQEARARTLMTIRQGRKYTDQEWKTLYDSASQADKDQMAVATPAELEKVVAHMGELKQLHSYDAAFASTIGAMAANDLRLSNYEKGFQKANTEGEGSLVLYGATNEYPVFPDGSIGRNRMKPNSIVMSAWETINQIHGINEGLLAQVKNVAEERIALYRESQSLKEALSKTTDPDTQTSLQHKIDVIAGQMEELDEREAVLANQKAASDLIVDRFDQLYDRFRNLTDMADVINLQDYINRLLERAYLGKWTDNDGNLLDDEMQAAIQRSVELKSGRHPFTDTGSFSILMPQISLTMTRLNMHGAAYVHQAGLEVAGADHDGDTVVPQHGLYIPPAQLQAFRRGQHFTSPVEVQEDNPAMGWKKGDIVQQVKVSPVDNEQAYLRVINDSLNDLPGTVHQAVKDELEKLDEDFMKQFAASRGNGTLKDEEVEKALRIFRASAYAGLVDARINLMNAIINIDPTSVFTMADERSEPQVLWMASRISQAWDGIQKRQAHYDAVNPQNVIIADEQARLPGDNQYQEEKARQDAYNAGQTLSAMGTNAPVRAGQTTHYSALYNAATYVPDRAGAHDYTGEMHDMLVELYENLGSGKTQSDIEAIMGRHAIEDRVVRWLTRIAEDLVQGSTKTTPEILLLLANVRVPNVKKEFDRHVVVEGEITLLQLLLSKSLDIEENVQRKAEPEADIRKKIANMRRLTQPQSEHSYSASKAVLEVFGNHQLYQLVGDSSMYISPQMTLNQLMKQLAGHSTRTRNQMLHTLERSPVYFSHNEMGDPPWNARALFDGQINAFTMLLDAVRVGAQVETKNMERQEEAAHNGFIQGLTMLHEAMASWRVLRGSALPKTDGKVSDKTVLMDLLENRPEFSQQIIDIIPDASKLGVTRLVEGQMQVANWVIDALLETDKLKAELMWWFGNKMAEFNVRGGTVDYSKDEQDPHPAGSVRYGSLQSRFLQSVYQMAKRPGGMDLTNMLEAYHNSASLEEFFTKFNANAAWRGPRADLLPYHDDVALFESDPRDVWNQNLPSSIQRENLVGWGTQMAVKGQVLVEQAANFADNFTLLEGMHGHRYPAAQQGVLDPQTQTHDGFKTYWELLDKAVENRRLMPDVQGQAARDQIVELLQEALVRMHDKGSADPRARAWGEALVTVDSFGWRDGLSLEANAMTALDFEDIRVNPTLLVDGPIRAMLSNGAMVEIDMSTPEGALAMLRDQRTQALAIAVLFPTVRDVNNANVLQTYLDVDDSGSIAKMLVDQNFGYLFDERSGHEELSQAHRYIGHIESYIRKKAMKLPKEDRAAMFAPIQNMINDYVTAYTHGPETQHMDHEKLRDMLIIDIANAIKAVAATDEVSREDLRRVILGVLEKRMLGSSPALDRMLMDDLSRQVLDNGLRSRVTKWAAEQFVEVDRLQDDAATETDPVKAQAMLDKAVQLEDDINEVLERINKKDNPLLPTSPYLSLARVQNMFTMTLDPQADAIRKMEILRFVGTQNRMNRFRDKGAPIELIKKLRRAVWIDRLNLINPDSFTNEEWEMLGAWCVQLYISDSAVRTGSSVALNPVVLGEKGDTTAKYYDKSYGYLIDTLFDENVIEAADFMARRNNYGIQHTSTDTAKLLQSTLLSEGRLGEWTDRIPVESLKARTVLLNAPVGAAVALGGNLPKEMFDALGSSTYTFKMPLPQHLSTHQMQGQAGDSVASMLSPTPQAYIALQNHFVSSLVVTLADGTVHDLFTQVTQPNFSHNIVTNSPYRVLDLARLDRAIQELGLTQNFTVDITYVDVNKQPPTLEWANNVFFDGVGRDSTAGASISAIAALFFGVNGISRISQQNPLDMAAKAGKAFMQYITSSLTTVKNLETAGAPIAEILGNKAMHMWQLEYDTGNLLASDLPALYKLMKMRHIVKGKLPGTGEVVYWWPEQAIFHEAAGRPIPLEDVQLIPLSDSVAQTLRGGGAYMGVKGAMTKPVLNLQDLDNLPSLDPIRLRELGLTHLGETVEPGNSPLAHISAPPRATMTPEKGAPIHSRYMQRAEQWRGNSIPHLYRRSQERGKGKGKLDISEFNKRGSQRINEILTYENMGPLLMRRGISHAQLLDPSAVKSSKALAAQIDNVMEDDNNIIWELVHGKGRNPSEGVLSIEDLRNSFADPNSRTPLFGDVVVVNLSSIMEANGQNLQKSYDQAKDTIRMLAKHGVTVVLGSKTGDYKLRNDLGAWMRSGNLGYRSLSRSPNFFAPILTGEEYGITRDAMESILTETRHYSGRYLELNLISDLPGTDLNENMARIDTKNSKGWKRVSHTIIPSAIDGTGREANGDQYSYNIPVAGIGDTDQVSIVSQTLLELLKNPDGTPNVEGRKHLAALASNDLSGDGNPSKVKRWFKKNENGTTDPGVLKLEDAMDRLVETLESGKLPTDKGQELMTGSLIPLAGADGSILIARVGFRLPDMLTLSQHLNAPIGKLKYEKGDKPLRIAIASDQIDKAQSVPPPFLVEETHPDEKGLSVRGTYKQGLLSKLIFEGLGFKAGLSALGDKFKFHDQPMSSNGTRVTIISSEQSIYGKQATNRTADNLGTIWAITGVDFSEKMVDLMYGKPANGMKRSEKDYRALWNNVRRILDEWAELDSPYTADDIARALDANGAARAFANEINAIGAKIDSKWRPLVLEDPAGTVSDPLKRLGTVIIATLAIPGVRVNDVISGSGLMSLANRDSDAKITELPQVMTQALNDPSYPELREMLIGEANSHFPKDANGKPLMYFEPDFTFHQRMQQKDVHGNWVDLDQKGTLQIVLPIAADENAVGLTQAAITTTTEVSPHIAATAAGAAGARTATRPLRPLKPGEERQPTRIQELFGENKIMRFDTGTGETFWTMLHQTMDDDPSYVPWEHALPFEEMHLEEGDAEVRAYTVPIDRDPPHRDAWTKEEIAATMDAADAFLEILNLKTAGGQERVEVDYLVRQFWGRPGPRKDQRDWREQITPKLYLEAVSLMTENIVDRKMHPLHGAAVPLEHMAFWKKVFFAQRGLPESKRWAPAKYVKGRRMDLAETWDEWNTTLMGQMLNSNKPFHAMWQTSLDGFLHTYQGTSPSFQSQMFSTDQMIQMKLMDPETNETYLSVSPGTRALMSSPVILDSMRVTYKALAGHPTSPSSEAARTMRTSELSEQAKQQRKWLEGQKLTAQRDLSVREYAKQGARYADTTRHTSALLRGIVNAQITNRLFNPQLYFSAIFEIPFRNSLEHATNVLTGGNISVGGKSQARLGRRYNSIQDAMAEGRIGQRKLQGRMKDVFTGLAELAPTVEAKFTPEQVTKLNRLAKDLGSNNQFLGEIMGEILYKRFVQAGGESRVGSFLEWSATAVARMTSAPGWGMKAPSVGKRYIEAAWEYLSLTDSLITPEQFIELLERDPLWFKNNSPEGKAMSAHTAGQIRVSQTRSTKQTVPSQIMMGKIDSLCDSSSTVANWSGHLLKIPFQFTRFNMNAFITLTGLGGFDQMAAMLLTGRRPGIMKRMQSLAQLEKDIDVTEVEPLDFSSVVEGLDLSRAFLRGAITQTGFMAAGAIMGGLGLGGEDKEERRRRRLAQHLHIPYLRDPRKAANDFLWADAIFLDNVPVLNTIFKDDTGHSAIVPHWILRQFLSPMLGIERFYETGDIREIGYGFWDAAAAMPNSVIRLYKEADLTAKLLVEAAKDAEKVGTIEKDAQVSQILINIVGVYEKALLENSFVNSVINSRDEFDRNPWQVPKTAELPDGSADTGELDRTQGMNLPQQTTALQSFVDPNTGAQVPEGTPGAIAVPLPATAEEGATAVSEIQQGYLTRSGWDARLHSWTENNQTAALLMSLFTGMGDSSYLRRNMVPKEQTVQMEPSAQAEVEALILSAWAGQGGQPLRTKDEIVRALQKRDQDAGIWWDMTKLENEAEGIFAAEQSLDGALSLLDKNEKEIITQAGMTGIYQSLWSGLIDFDHPSLQGISASKEMRDNIAEEWLTRIQQEGIDLGLSDQAASYRTNRIWWGDKTDPDAPGLRELLYDKRIPVEADAHYYQQNTTYAIGPDGRPWATPFQRMNTLQAFGVPMPHQIREVIPGVTALDERGNVIDLVRGINTGMAAIRPKPYEPIVPDDKPLEKALAKEYTPGGGKGRRYRGGGGGGGGYDYGPNFNRMLPLPGGQAPRYDNIPMINVNTPYIRRASIHRERIQGERGRLKQWQ